MNAIRNILNTTSTTSHREALDLILSQAFLNEDGQLDFDREVSGADLISLLGDVAKNLEVASDRNTSTIAEVVVGPDSDLDNVVHDLFSDAASDINNGGSAAQIAYLVVEAGLSPNQIS